MRDKWLLRVCVGHEKSYFNCAFHIAIDFKKCPCKRAQLFSLSTWAFSVISHFHLLFLSFCHARFFFFFNVVPSSAHFHVAGPDKWIRGPWQVIAVVQHVQEYVFSIKFLLCFSLPAAYSYQVYHDTKTLIGPRANKWPIVSQGDKLLVGLHVTEYWMLIGRGRGVGYNRETKGTGMLECPSVHNLKEFRVQKVSDQWHDKHLSAHMHA